MAQLSLPMVRVGPLEGRVGPTLSLYMLFYASHIIYVILYLNYILNEYIVHIQNRQSHSKLHECEIRLNIFPTHISR